jgi:hypothetical protein
MFRNIKVMCWNRFVALSQITRVFFRPLFKKLAPDCLTQFDHGDWQAAGIKSLNLVRYYLYHNV